MLVFCRCEVSKRRYMKGWHISNSSAVKSVTGSKRKECILPKVCNQETVETASISDERKVPERVLTLSIPEEFETKKHTMFTPKFATKHKAVKRQKRTEQGYNNNAFLIAEYTAFGLSIGSAALGFATLSSFVTLGIVFFASAIILFLISVLLSHIAIRKIRRLNLDHKITPHAIIIGITLGIFCLVVAGVVALIAALAIGNPAVTIVAGLITFLLLMIVALSKI